MKRKKKPPPYLVTRSAYFFFCDKFVGAVIVLLNSATRVGRPGLLVVEAVAVGLGFNFNLALVSKG